jgi:hypothetical protein
VGRRKGRLICPDGREFEQVWKGEVFCGTHDIGNYCVSDCLYHHRGEDAGECVARAGPSIGRVSPATELRPSERTGVTVQCFFRRRLRDEVGIFTTSLKVAVPSSPKCSAEKVP